MMKYLLNFVDCFVFDYVSPLSENVTILTRPELAIQFGEIILKELYNGLS